MPDALSMMLLDRWKNLGDEEAAADLFRRYAGRLIAVARRRLSPRLARRVDPQDAVQSACRTFFLRVRDGRLEVKPGGDLWHLLVAITVRKVLSQAEYHTAGRRDVSREDSVTAPDGLSLSPIEALARNPGPPEEAAFAEELGAVLGQLLPVRRRIVELRLQGYLQAEIARATGRSERLVRLALDEFGELLRARWSLPAP
jgi:DNA-directed RNA polymerase specialized sigma24 family protein